MASHPTAPRLSTVPSSIKPRQLVSYLFHLHISGACLGRMKTDGSCYIVTPPRTARTTVSQLGRSRESTAHDERPG